MQFLAKNNAVKVIECNLRASRSFPFASKVTGYNFIEIATYAMLNHPKIAQYKNQKFHTLDMEYVGVKTLNSHSQDSKAPIRFLAWEMASTGEVACFETICTKPFLESPDFSWVCSA